MGVENLDARRKRLLYQSRHRGMQEMDLLLGRFAERFLDGMTDVQLDEFDAVLVENDLDLLNWITGKEPVPEALDTEIMHSIIDFRTLAIKP